MRHHGHAPTKYLIRIALSSHSMQNQCIESVANIQRHISAKINQLKLFKHSQVRPIASSLERVDLFPSIKIRASILDLECGTQKTLRKIAPQKVKDMALLFIGVKFRDIHTKERLNNSSIILLHSQD